MPFVHLISKIEGRSAQEMLALPVAVVCEHFSCPVGVGHEKAEVCRAHVLLFLEVFFTEEHP